MTLRPSPGSPPSTLPEPAPAPPVAPDRPALPPQDPHRPPGAPPRGARPRRRPWWGRTWTAPWTPLLLWALGRAYLVGTAWSVTPYPSGDISFDDVRLYGQWSAQLAHGTIPVSDFWQYPPLAGVVFLAARVLPDPFVGFLLVALLADLAVLLLLLRRPSRAGAWLWAGASALVGPVLVGRFDVVVSLAAVLAVLAAGRPGAAGRAGAWAAAGALLKVWPAFLLAAVPRRSLPRALGYFAGTAAVLLAALAVWFDGVWGFLGGQGERGLQIESVGALPFVLAKAAGVGVTYTYRYGSTEVDVTGAGVVAAAVTVVGVVLAALVVRAWWVGRLERSGAADVAFTVVLLSVVVSRVFSPQYVVWLLALGAVCLSAPGSRVRLPVALVAASGVAAQVVYPAGYGEFCSGTVWVTAVQVLRLGLVLAAAGLCLRDVVLRPPAPAPGAAAPGAAAR